MPETRYIDTYENGVLVSHVPYTVSDAELAIESIKKETDTANDQALAAYQNWSSLNPIQKDKVLKTLLGDFISRNRERYT